MNNQFTNYRLPVLSQDIVYRNKSSACQDIVNTQLNVLG